MLSEPIVLPHSEECERAVLGSVFQEPHLIAEIDLTSTDFYQERNQIIFATFCELAADKQPIDLRTVQARIEQAGDYERVGGLAYLTGLDLDLPDASRFAYYARVVKERAAQRQLIRASAELMRAVCDGSKVDLEAVIEGHAKRLEVVRRSLVGVDVASGFTSMFELLRPADYLMGRANERAELGTVFTGLPDLDGMIAGFRPGTLWVAAGAPGAGKTALAMQIAEHNAIGRSVSTGIVSLEMVNDELLERLAAAQAQVDYSAVRKGRMTTAQRDEVAAKLTAIQFAPLHIDDSSSLSAKEISARVRRLYQQEGCELVVVDYLGLIKLERGPKDERHDIRLGEVCLNLAELAKELRIVVLVACQLSRRPAQEKRKPQISDLADSASIERHAFGIVLIHRDCREDARALYEPTGSLLLAKHRGGETGEVGVYFDGAHQTFRELAWSAGGPA